MIMNLEDVDPERLKSEVERLRGELEQAAVALEDINEWAGRLAASNEQLAAQLQVEVKAREEADRRLLDLLSKPQPEAADRQREREDALKAQLSVTLEELQVMAEEFQAAQEEFRRAKREAGLGVGQMPDDGSRERRLPRMS